MINAPFKNRDADLNYIRAKVNMKAGETFGLQSTALLFVTIAYWEVAVLGNAPSKPTLDIV